MRLVRTRFVLSASAGRTGLAADVRTGDVPAELCWIELPGRAREMDKKRQGKILAQLRRIYDGQFSREFGTAENMTERTWTGRLTMLAGATPAVDRQYSISQALGGKVRQDTLAPRWRSGSWSPGHDEDRVSGRGT